MLKLTDIRQTLHFRITHLCISHTLASFVDNRLDVGRVKIDWDVYLPTKGINLQRPFVWTLQQKQDLIISILKGIKIAHFTVIEVHSSENVEKTIRIIDGKQRLSTLIAFYKGEFPIVWNDEEFYYKDLDEKAQREISGFTLMADVAYEDNEKEIIPDDQKIAWFEQINFLGTPQDEEHLNNLKK